MLQRLCQCADLQRSFFPLCFSVLLRPVRQITSAAFDAEEAVWSLRSLKGRNEQRRREAERTKANVGND